MSTQPRATDSAVPLRGLIPAQRTSQDSTTVDPTRRAQSALRILGGVVTPALVAQLWAGALGSAESRSPRSYYLVGNESVRDEAARSWTYLKAAWVAWRDQDATHAEGHAGTGSARDQWLLPLLRELGYGQVPTTGNGVTVDDTVYPVSHLWQNVPVHLLGPGVDLDRRNPGVAGAARAPQAMLQELLNRSDPHLWAVLSNGLKLRLLRDSTSLAGSSYLEFDLVAIFEDEQFAEWFLLYQLCHVSRLEVRGDPEAPPEDCWLEDWRADAGQAGARALERLRDGVEKAIAALGAGFVSHPSNAWLVDALRAGTLTTDDYHRSLLRLVYRMLFLFVAEDRELLLDPSVGTVAHARYDQFFSTGRLRRQSRTRVGSSHGDLWQTTRLVLRLAGETGLPEIGLPALGGLFERDARQPLVAGAPETDLLLGAEIANSDLLTAIRGLAWIEDGQRVVPIDYRHLGAEELGGVYESLLELVPELDIADRVYRLRTLHGNDRKTTGSYYTPASLVSALLDSALDPVIEAAAPAGADPIDAEAALLELTVCDPACGSGGFLVAAARRIARRLADVRAGDDQASPDDETFALRDVISHSIYGVDLNDLALELAKVSLWLESMVPGLPLTFLDSHLRVGNALMGATPALIQAGVPNDAFKPIEGDDKAAASQARKNNAAELKQRQPTLPGMDVVAALASGYDITQRSFENMNDVRRAQEAFASRLKDERYLTLRAQADAWCSAFVWKLGFGEGHVLPPTTSVVRRLSQPEHGVPKMIMAEVERLTAEYRFFHWHLEFPEVFSGAGAEGVDGWAGGFSCVLGNPPWERVKLQEQEFFASRDPEIAKAPNKAARDRLIKILAEEDPELYAAFLAARRRAEGQSAILRLSGRYPLNGRGDVNTYAVFTELFRNLTGPVGHAGVIAPTGIATDATTQHFFKDLVSSRSLASIYGFDHRSGLFKGVQMQFCLLVMTGRERDSGAASFAFGLTDPTQIPSSTFELTPEEINLLNPNTATCPIFHTRRDAEITLGIYRRVPVLMKEGDPDGNPWGISFMTMFHMSNDSHLFHTRDDLERDGWTLEGNIFVRGVGASQERMLPLYEAKMIHHYDHQWATYERDGSVRNVTTEEKVDHDFAPMPRYWIGDIQVQPRLNSWQSSGDLIGFRDVARATDERTMICSRLPRVAVGHKLPLINSNDNQLIQVMLSSFAFDYVARQKVGGASVGYFVIRQLPVPGPGHIRKCGPLVEERLRRISMVLAEPARPSSEVDALRIELEAVIFHVYGLSREDVEYIMDNFLIAKKRDLALHGSYQTKDLILKAYDSMRHAINSNQSCQQASIPSQRLSASEGVEVSV